jgi:uncharacterized protein (DUF2141 family)
MRFSLLTLLNLIALSGAYSQDATLSLIVSVEDAEPNVGQVIVSLFNSENYLEMPIVEEAAPVDENGRCTLIFTDLVIGEYAAIAVYDEDMDGKLDTGLFRIPREKIGYSNNATGRMGPASYEDAKFVLSPAMTAISISLAAAN